MTPAEIHAALVSCPGPLALDVANELRRLHLLSWGEASPSAVMCTLTETGTMLLREQLRAKYYKAEAKQDHNLVAMAAARAQGLPSEQYDAAIVPLFVESLAAFMACEAAGAEL